MTGKLATTRPGKPAQESVAKHVERATRAVTSETEEKQLKVIVPTKFHKGTSDIKNMSTDSVAVKYLVIEALEDLFKKYERGDGHYSIDDQEELARRLKSLK